MECGGKPPLWMLDVVTGKVPSPKSKAVSCHRTPKWRSL